MTREKSGVKISGLGRDFGSNAAIKSIDLNIEPGEFVALLGPSGCGKTTTLRCLAGLEIPTRGEISIGDQKVFSETDGLFVPPENRHIGMVFQNYALWPHMTVRGNVGYPLKFTKTDKKSAEQQLQSALERVHLGGKIDEAATSLSGGQQQRVALARAMVNRPSVMLFDEPLSNLDAKLRLAMRAQIRELHDEIGTTSVYVTHDQEEAIALADRVVVMNEGRIEQIGNPRELYSRPASTFVADFMGFQNILLGTVTSSQGKELAVTLQGTRATVRVLDEHSHWNVGDELMLAFRAGHVRVHAPNTVPDAISARVVRTSYLGSSLRVLTEIDGVEVRTQIDEADFGVISEEDLVPGAEVGIAISAHNLVPLPKAEIPMSTESIKQLPTAL